MTARSWSAPPSRVPGGSPWNACCDGATPHRQAVNPINGAFYVAQRFAIDFARLTPDRRLVDGDPEALASWPSYGAEVVSAARGVVVGTRDGFADNSPVGSLPPISLDNVGGNYVVIDIGGGRFAWYAHLQPGSLRVSVGDRVRRGQRLGLVGNSGNTDFPHLHFHVMDSPSPLASDGLPYVFDRFCSPGSIANVDELAAASRPCSTRRSVGGISAGSRWICRWSTSGPECPAGPPRAPTCGRWAADGSDPHHRLDPRSRPCGRPHPHRRGPRGRPARTLTGTRSGRPRPCRGCSRSCHRGSEQRGRDDRPRRPGQRHRPDGRGHPQRRGLPGESHEGRRPKGTPGRWPSTSSRPTCSPR